MNKHQERIKELRKELGKSQEKLSEVLKTSQSNYSKYEKGKIEMSLEQVKIMCEYYNISADYLLGLTDEKQNYIKNKYNFDYGTFKIFCCDIKIPYFSLKIGDF